MILPALETRWEPSLPTTDPLKLGFNLAPVISNIFMDNFTFGEFTITSSLSGAKYQMLPDIIGQGEFSCLRRGINLSEPENSPNRDVAIKFPTRPIEPDHLDLYKKEMHSNYSEMMKRTSSSSNGKGTNPNSSRFVEILDYFIEDLPYENGIFYQAPVVVMKRYKRKLRDLISERSKKAQRFQLYEIVNFMNDFFWGLTFLYKNGKCFCQFSLDTIFIDDEGGYVLGDYAISAELKESIATLNSRRVVFDYYSPPEYTPSHKYDVYMFGAILYEMVTFRKYKLDLLTNCVMKAGPFEDLICLCVQTTAEKRGELHTIHGAAKGVVSKYLSNKCLVEPLGEQDLMELMAFSYFCEYEIEALYPKHFKSLFKKSKSEAAGKVGAVQSATAKFIGPLNDPVKNPLGEGKSKLASVGSNQPAN